MKPISKKRIAAGAGAGIVLLLILLLLRPSPLPVDAGRLMYGPLRVVVEAEGMTRVVDRFTVASPVSGRFLRSRLVEGDSVSAGGELASIVPPSLNTREYREASAAAASSRAAIGEADARRRQIEVNLAQARLRSTRYDNLYREGAVSKESWEQARNDAAVLEKSRLAAVRASESAAWQYEAAAARFDRNIAEKPVRVISPASGRVLRIHEKSERTVVSGTPLFDIGDPGRIELVIDLLSSDAVRVRPGQRVLIEGWGEAGVLGAKVLRIEPAAFTKVSALGIEEKRVNVIALLDRPEPRLGDNYRVQATIVVDEAPKVLKVPVSSLFRSGDGWRVFVIDGGRAVERNVSLGLRGTYEAEVLSGLKTGELVVLHPANELRNGSWVKVRQPE